MLNGIVTARPRAAQWLLVDKLVDACRSVDGLEIPLTRMAATDSQQVNQFFYFEDDTLTGIATLPAGREIEVLGAVHPSHRNKGVGRKLLNAVIGECLNRDVADFLLVSEAASVSGGAFAERVGGCLEFSEHRMELNRATASTSRYRSTGLVDLQLAKQTDINTLVELNHDQSDEAAQTRRTIERWLTVPACRIFIGRHQGAAIGMIRVTDSEEAIWLNSFALLPSARGQGWGRAFLNAILAALDPHRKTLLEVETDNNAALALYRSAGFRTTMSYHYYRISTMAEGASLSG